MDKWDQQFIDVLMRSRNVVRDEKRGSKAAALAVGRNKAQLIHDFIFSKYWVNWNRFWRSETRRRQRRSCRTSQVCNEAASTKARKEFHPVRGMNTQQSTQDKSSPPTETTTPENRPETKICISDQSVTTETSESLFVRITPSLQVSQIWRLYCLG